VQPFVAEQPVGPEPHRLGQRRLPPVNPRKPDVDGRRPPLCGGDDLQLFPVEPL
jgi:hypothetical protein